MLCNPNFIKENNQYFDLNPIYFLYPLTSLPKMVKQEMPASVKQSQLFVLVTSCLVLLCLPRSIKGKCLLSCVDREREESGRYTDGQ